MQNTREEALKLFDEHYKLIYFTLNRFYPTNAMDEDCQQIAAIGLWKACLCYDPEKASFASYAVNSIKNELADTIRRASFKCRKPELPLVYLYDESLCEDVPLYNTVPMIETKVIWTNPKSIKDILTERQFDILKYTREGMSVRKIGEIIGVSRTIVSIEQRKIKQILKDNISEI